MERGFNMKRNTIEMVEIRVMLFIAIIQIIYHGKKVSGLFLVFFKSGFYIFRTTLLHNPLI